MTTVSTLEQADQVLDRLVSPEGRDDPYPLYRELRELAPFYRSGWDGLWYASGYDDCKAVLVDPRCGRHPDGMIPHRHGMNPRFAEQFRKRLRSTMLTENPPEHTRLRAPVSRAFTPRRVNDLGPRIAERLEPMLDHMAEAGEVDLMRVIAFPLPVAVIGDLVGVPEGEREQFRELVRATQARGRARRHPRDDHGGGPGGRTTRRSTSPTWWCGSARSPATTCSRG